MRVTIKGMLVDDVDIVLKIYMKLLSDRGYNLERSGTSGFEVTDID